MGIERTYHIYPSIRNGTTMKRFFTITFFTVSLILSGCSADSLVGSESDYTVDVTGDTHNATGDTHNATGDTHNATGDTHNATGDTHNATGDTHNATGDTHN